MSLIDAEMPGVGAVRSGQLPVTVEHQRDLAPPF
jgi:hypothetical protein